jgi:O-methyltransferase
MVTYEQAFNYAQKIAYSMPETLINTYRLSCEVIDNRILGSFVETGVAAGGQIIMMKKALQDKGNTMKNIFACDSFQGIPMPTNKDNQMAGIRYLTADEILLQPNPDEYDKFLKSSGATCHSLNDFKNNIINSGVGLEQIIPIEGWFEYTMPSVIEQLGIFGISLLRLDGDNYSSTKVVLEKLYDYVNIGGYVIIDDWALEGCRTACEEFFSKRNFYPEIKEVYSASVTYFKKQHD